MLIHLGFFGSFRNKQVFLAREVPAKKYSGKHIRSIGEFVLLEIRDGETIGNCAHILNQPDNTNLNRCHNIEV